VPEGTVFNLYTQLDATLNITAHRGIPAILSAPYYLDQTQAYRMGPGEGHDTSNTAGVESIGSSKTGGPTRQFMQERQQVANSLGDHHCGTVIRHIDTLWTCFYSASPTDGVDADLASNTSLVMGGEACIW
jgi:hypothetical protein